MADILHRLSIEAPAGRVHELVTTPTGVEEWWTGHAVAGHGGIGGKMFMFFGGSDPAAVMEVTEDTPDQITWPVVDGPTDWVDTDITFTFRPNDNGGTTLLFSHARWREAGSSWPIAVPSGPHT